ncbi:restriction endonuclease [Kordia sp.]|uniref:restriction endonuclease n=1 Tax=Kordia sp. TaxID=1965332 RepID=UPI003D280554
MNKNIEYEKYVMLIYNEILNNESINNVILQHDIKIKGKTGTHQIDVYWKYRQFGELIRVAIECKRYASNITIGHVRSFKSVIEDINCSKGIIVTTKGFQKGAIEYAKNNNISLKVIRKPNTEELLGIPENLNITINITPRKVKSISVDLDRDWCITNVDGIADDYSETIGRLNTSMVLIDKYGNKIANFLDLENQLPVKKAPSNDILYKFDYSDDDIFMVDENQKLLKVISVTFIYDILNIERTESSSIHADIKAIVKDCINNKTTFI